MGKGKKLRILVADDHAVVRQGLIQILTDAGGIEVVAEVGNGNDVLRALDEHQVDVLLMDHDMSLVKRDIFEFDCLCAMRAEDPLAQKQVITPDDLSGKPMATLFEEHPTYLQTKAAFLEMGAKFNPMFEAQYFIPLYTFIERGLAYAVIDQLSARSYQLKSGQRQGEIVFRPFIPRVKLATLVLTPAHKPQSLLAQQFQEKFKDMLGAIKSNSFSDLASRQ